jgi:anti-sigma factor RsiW
MKLSEEELALIHAALDGELMVEQHQRLADLLSQSSAARKYYSVAEIPEIAPGCGPSGTAGRTSQMLRGVHPNTPGNRFSIPG